MSVAERTRKRRSTFNWDNGRTRYPAIDDTTEAWAKVLEDQPDVFYSMIGDIIKVAKATEGTKRTGRRPQVTGMTIDDLWNTLYPHQYAMEPFTEAFAALLGTTSQRQFAARIPCNQATLSRLLSGRLSPDLPMLEAIAAAAKVAPTYFAEYRAWKLADLVGTILQRNPNMSITFIKRLIRESR